MATRGSYVHISMGIILGGHPDNNSFMQFSTKIDGFEQKDSPGLWELVQLLWTIPIREIFHFHIYQNYTLALMCLCAFVAPNYLPIHLTF